MLEDYFYKDIPDLTTESEMYELKCISDELLEQDKFIPLTPSISNSPDRGDFTVTKTNYTGGAYGIRVSMLMGTGDYAWTEQQKRLPIALRDRYGAIGAHFAYTPSTIREVPKHVDKKIRACTISFPISLDNAPTYFYETIESKHPCYVCKYDKPVLLNTQKPHSIKNNEQLRMVFQLTFATTYEATRKTILDIHDPRKLGEYNELT